MGSGAGVASAAGRMRIRVGTTMGVRTGRGVGVKVGSGVALSLGGMGVAVAAPGTGANWNS